MIKKLHTTSTLALLAFVVLIIMPGKGWGQTTVFSDDFNRATLSPGGTPSMTYTKTLASGVTADIVSSTYLSIANTTTAGISYVSAPVVTFSTPYSSTLNSNPGIVTWTFNFRWNRVSTNNPAIPISGSYGQAIVLASSSSNLSTISTGYAIVYGSTGTPDPIRLVRFNGGVLGTLTDICSSGTSDIANTNNYASVRVTFDPTTSTWALFVRDDGTSAWADPSTGVTSQKGSNTVNNTYTGSALTHFGFLWSHATTAGNTGDFDNFKVTVVAPINYYSKATGNLELPGSWTDDITLAGGSQPANFTADNQIFNIRNNATPTIGADWTVSGTGSKIIVGNGTNACNFTIPSSFKVTGTVDVAASATLTIANTTNYPTLGTLSATGTVAYTGASAQTIAAATYGSLSISTTGGNATAGGAIGVTTALTVASGSIFDMSTFAMTGAALTTSGTGTLKTQNTTSTPLPTGRTWSMDVSYNNASGQTVIAGNYNNLDITGGNRTLISGGTIAIAGTYTPGAGTLTVSSNTISFNGSSPQNLPAATYNNIIIANAAGVTVSANTQVIGGTTTLTSGALILPIGASNLVTFTGAISASSGTITGSSTSNISTSTISTSFAFTSGGQALNNWTINGVIGSTTGPIGLNSPITINGTLSQVSSDMWSTSAGAITILSGATYNETAAGFYRGAGAITISSGATFNIFASGGLVSSGLQGVIQVTGTRTFSGGANYSFSNASSSITIGDAIDGAGGTGKTGPLTGTLTLNSSTTTGVSLNSGTTYTLGAGGVVNIAANSIVSTGTAIFSSVAAGNGTVNMLGGATLNVLNASGINGVFPSGYTGTLNLNNSGTNNTNFTFNGSVAQVTGSLLPATVNNLNFANTFSGSVGSPSIVLSASYTVAGTLTFAGGAAPAGLVGIGAGNTLTANGVITVSNAAKLVGTSTSNFIIGGSGSISATGLFAATGGGTLQDFTMNRGSTTVTVGNPLTIGGTFSNSAGVVAMSTNTLTLNGPITFGSGTLTSTGPLVIGGTGAISGTINGTLTFTTLTMNRSGANLALGANASVSSATSPLTLTAGNITLGAFNLTATSNASTATLGTGSSSSMIVATSATIGKAYVTITTGVSGLRTFPVGDGTNYTPVTLSFSANTVGGTIGVNVTATAHSQLNLTGNPQANYISRYWSFTTTGLTNYTYSSTFTYVPGDITGDQTLMKLNRYTGSAWAEDATSSAAANVLTSTTGLTQATGLLNGNDFTGRKEPSPVSYTWVGGTSVDYNTASNWSPSGIPSLIDDVLINTGSGNMPEISSGTFSVKNLTINNASATLGITGGSLTVVTSQTLTAGAINLSNAASLTFSTALTIPGGFTITENNTSTVLGSGANTINASGVLTLNNSSTFTSTGAFSNGGNLNLNGTSNLTVNNASFALTGTQTFASGSTTTLSTAVAAIPAMTYGNLSLSASSGTYGVAGDFTISGNFSQSGASTFQLNNQAASATRALIINGNMILSGSASIFNCISISTAGNTDLTVGGNLNISGSSTLNLESTSSTNGRTLTTVTGSINLSGSATRQLNLGVSSGSLANNEVRVAGNFTLSAGGIGTSGSSGTGLTFNGSGTTQQLSATSGYSWTEFPITINVGAVVQVITNNLSFGSTAPISNITVNGTLNTGLFTITGASGMIFTLGSGGTFITEVATGMTGAIPTWGTKTLSSAANYEFQGASTGTFTTTPTTFTVNNLTINKSSGVSLGQSFAVNGTLTLTSGAISLNLKTLSFGSIGILKYNGTSYTTTSDAEFPATNGPKDLNISDANALGLTLHANRTLAGSLTIANGKVFIIPSTKQLTVTGTLTNNADITGLVLKSDATGTGSLIHNTADVPATIERYITGSSTLTTMQYHQVSIPLTAAANPTSNLFVGSYLFDFTEAALTSGDWNPLGNSTSTALDVDKGYLIYYPENTPATYTFAGPLRNGTVSPVITYADASHGYNLVPNPYPSAINWALIPTKTNLADAFWTWNPALLNYGAYGTAVGLGTSSTTQYIPVGQAFFVRATSASPALSLTNAARVHNSQPFLKNTENFANILRLSVSGNNSSDEVLVAFNTTWTSGSDNADVHKMYGTDTSPQLSCIASDGEHLSINALPFTSGDVIVPLAFSLNASTDVTFTASGMESFYESIPMYLEDLTTGTITDLRANPVYTFSHTAGDAGNRFRLRFKGVTGTPEQPTTAPGHVFVSQGKLFVDIPAMQQSMATLSVFDALGRQLISRKEVLQGIVQLPAPTAPGVYIVRVMTGNMSFTGKVVVNQ